MCKETGGGAGKRNRKRLLTIGLSAALLLGILLQYSTVGLYFDDYGNASLSYGYDASDIRGTDYSAADLLRWAESIYKNWGGRILYALIMIPMIKNSALPFMLFQAVMIFFISAVMYKIVKQYCGAADEPLALAGLIVMYGLLKGTILTWGMYWASASVLYVLPMLPFFICVSLYCSVKKRAGGGKSPGRRDYILFFLLIPLVTLSQEQIGGAFAVWSVYVLALGFMQKRQSLYRFHFFVFIWTCVTFFVFFSAPGNWVRFASDAGFAEMSFLEKIKRNLPLLAALLTAEDLSGIHLLLWTAGVLMLKAIYAAGKKKAALIFSAGIAPFGVRLACMKLGGLFMGLQASAVRYQTAGYFLFLFCMLSISVLYFHEKNADEFAALLTAGGASVFCLLIAPSLAMRSFLPFVMVCMLLIDIVVYTFCRENKNALVRCLCGAAAVYFACTASVNLYKTYHGYRENQYADRYNAKKLREYHGADAEIVLMKYKNDTYRAPAPYDEGFEFCEFWIKKYYDIPQDVSFVWKTEEGGR